MGSKLFGPILPGGESGPIKITHEIVGDDKTLDRGHRLAIFGFFKYRDRFRSEYLLKFCFISETQSVYFFTQMGPPGYNQET